MFIELNPGRQPPRGLIANPGQSSKNYLHRSYVAHQKSWIALVPLVVELIEIELDCSLINTNYSLI